MHTKKAPQRIGYPGIKVINANPTNKYVKAGVAFNWFEWKRDGKEIPKIHPTQKSVKTLKDLISIFTDPGDVVIDPCAGSGSSLRAALELGRNSYGFEIDRKMCKRAQEEMIDPYQAQYSLFDTIEA